MGRTNLFSIFLLLCPYLGWCHTHSSIVTVRYEDPLPSKLGHSLPYLHYPHFIYNRGKDDLPKEYHVITELSNVGREGFIYLKHIYLHYENLSDITIFASMIM